MHAPDHNPSQSERRFHFHAESRAIIIGIFSEIHGLQLGFENKNYNMQLAMVLTLCYTTWLVCLFCSKSLIETNDKYNLRIYSTA